MAIKKASYYFVGEYCPTMEKRSMCIPDHMQPTSFYLGKFLKKLADDQCASTTKGGIYYMKHMHIQHFSLGVD